MAAAYKSAIGPGLLVPKKPAVREGVEPEGHRRGVRPCHTHTHVRVRTRTSKNIPLIVQKGHGAHAAPQATTQSYAQEHILLSHHAHTHTHVPLTTAAAAAAAIGPYAVRGMAAGYEQSKLLREGWQSLCMAHNIYLFSSVHEDGKKPTGAEQARRKDGGNVPT